MHRFFIFAFVIVACLICGLYYLFHHVPESRWIDLTSEHGLVELPTAIMFGIAAFFGAFQTIRTTGKMDVIFMVLMAMGGAREMDWHKEWTTDSILKSRFYLDANTPVIEKIIGAIIIIFLVYAAWQLLKRIPQFIAAIWHFSAKAWSIAMGLGMLVMAKTLDSMARLFPFMAEFHGEHRAFLGVVEETMELSGAVFFVIYAVMQVRRG